jgi:hypothetical protein
MKKMIKGLSICMCYWWEMAVNVVLNIPLGLKRKVEEINSTEAYNANDISCLNSRHMLY